MNGVTTIARATSGVSSGSAAPRQSVRPYAVSSAGASATAAERTQSTAAAASAEPPRRVSGSDAHGRRDDGGDRVPGDHVVGPHEREHDRRHDDREGERARDERAATLARGEADDEHDTDDEEQRGERAPERLGREAVPDREVLRDPGDSADEGGSGDRLAVAALGEHERHVRERARPPGRSNASTAGRRGRRRTSSQTASAATRKTAK